MRRSAATARRPTSSGSTTTPSRSPSSFRLVHKAEYETVKENGEVVLFDAKTSKAAYLSHHVQLAGYAYGCVESGFPGPDRAMVVLLRPDGTYECVEGCAGYEDWQAACAAHAATKRIGKLSRAAAKEAVAA